MHAPTPATGARPPAALTGSPSSPRSLTSPSSSSSSTVRATVRATVCATVLAAVLAALSTSTSARAQLPDGATSAADGCRVVVLNLQGKNLPDSDKDVPALLTETLANEVNLVSGCQVVTQADVASMLDFEATKASCTDGADSCLSEIGAALGAERIVGGSLGKLGRDFVLNVRLMNVKQGAVESRAEQVVPGAVEKLRLASKNAARQLFHQELLVDTSDAPPTTTTPAAEPSSSPLSPLFLAGAGVGGVGVVALGIGGALVGVAESRLSDPTETAKDDVVAEGQVALVVATVGAVAVVAGVSLVVAALIVE